MSLSNSIFRLQTQYLEFFLKYNGVCVTGSERYPSIINKEIKSTKKATFLCEKFITKSLRKLKQNKEKQSLKEFRLNK